MRDTVEAILRPMIEAVRIGQLDALMRHIYREALARAIGRDSEAGVQGDSHGRSVGRSVTSLPQIIGGAGRSVAYVDPAFRKIRATRGARHAVRISRSCIRASYWVGADRAFSPNLS
jgi:hypothetical protein